MFVKAFSVDDAMDIADKIVRPYDMIVKDVIRPGHELYGEDEANDADPLPKYTVTENTFPNVRVF